MTLRFGDGTWGYGGRTERQTLVYYCEPCFEIVDRMFHLCDVTRPPATPGSAAPSCVGARTTRKRPPSLRKRPPSPPREAPRSLAALLARPNGCESWAKPPEELLELAEAAGIPENELEAVLVRLGAHKTAAALRAMAERKATLRRSAA